MYGLTLGKGQTPEKCFDIFYISIVSDCHVAIDNRQESHHRL